MSPSRKIRALRDGFLATLVSSVWRSNDPTGLQTSGIAWFACPDSETTKCAFLDVPRDYSNPSDNDTVSVFMRMLPATVSPERRLGTILTNPGGPGGSGSMFVALAGEGMSKLADGRYDILGFDPRGVNLTGPPTACFSAESKALHMEYQELLLGAPFPHLQPDAQRVLVTKLGSLQATLGAACLANGNHDMLESLGTATVVQDMVQIVEALGEDGLNFLGYSYGTILGATFAAMRPDMVKRMVLDGVSNAESYFNDVLQWGRDGMAETHKTLTGFFSTCVDAGPKHCAFAVPTDESGVAETVGSLRKRLDKIYARLNDKPMTVADSMAGPGTLTASDLRYLLLVIMYSPSAWSLATQVLTQVEQGDATLAYGILYATFADIHSQPYTQNVYNRSMQNYFTPESLRPILCSDTAPTNISDESYGDYIREMGKISPFGEPWALITGACRGWSFRAKERYTGPWTVAEGLRKTRFPILFLSLDADPVTPLSSALHMSRGFGNESATLLIQQGYGHCTIAHPSLCTLRNVRDYFVDGKVPVNGTHCVAEPGFIYPTNNTLFTREAGAMSKDDEELLSSASLIRKARNIYGI
ncbi:alpha/beta-hydrolase [Ceratobasidium sp. AG-I]|nr:alpha/beta-hydrolase [Ceratobasidium sp. AG-I]